MRRSLLSCLFLGAIFFFLGCPTTQGPAPTAAKSITAFSFPGLEATISIDDAAKAITVRLPAGTDLRALAPTFMTSGVSVRVGSVVQVSGTTPNDFSASVRYEVFAADGTSVTYTVTVSLEPSASKAISAFSFAIPLATCTIDETTKAIAVTVPYGTLLSALVASFQTSGASVKVGSVIQTSGVTANDFSQPLRYEVVAADGTSAFYTVTVTPASSDAKALKSFSFASPDASGIIDEAAKVINVSVPFGTPVSALVATFETTGASVLVGSLVQATGVSANDFSQPVSYEVRAANGTSAYYTVVVTVAPSGAKQIKAFAILDPRAEATIDETAKTIALRFPYGTSVTSLVASFETTGSSVTAGSVVQVSGQTPNDFSAPLKYHVLAADGSEAVYTVTVTVDSAPPSSAKAILSFSFLAADNPGRLSADVVGSIREDVKYVEALLPAGTTANSLKPRIVVSAGATIAPASLGTTDFSHTVAYTVKAEDGSELAYSVAAIPLPASPEMVVNGDFCYGKAFWSSTNKADVMAVGDFSNGKYVLAESGRGNLPEHCQLASPRKNLTRNGLYQVSFDASSTATSDFIIVVLAENGMDINGDGNTSSVWRGAPLVLGAAARTYSFTWVMSDGYDDPEAQLAFFLGGTTGTINISNVSLKKIGTYAAPLEPEMAYNGDFNLSNAGWECVTNNLPNGAATSVGNFSGGNFLLLASETARGDSSYRCQLNTEGMSLRKNGVYQLVFEASSTVATDMIGVRLREHGKDVNGDGNIWTAWASSTLSLGTTSKAYSYSYIMSSDFDDPNADLTFLIGGTSGTIRIDNVSLKKIGTFTPPTAPEMVWNGNFSAGSSYWMSYQDSTCTGATTDFSGSDFKLGGTSRGSNYWAYQLETTKSLSLEKNTIYKCSLKASSTASTDLIHVAIREAGTDINRDGDKYTCWDSVDFSLSPTQKNYTSYLATKAYDDPEAQIVIGVGHTTGTISIDDISLQKIGAISPPAAPEMVWNGTFAYGQSYWQTNAHSEHGATANCDFSTSAFRLPATENLRGSESWHLQLLSTQKALVRNGIYRVSFDASSTVGTDSIQVGLDNGNGSNYITWAMATPTLGTTLRNYTYTWVMPSDSDDPTARLFFFMGNTTGAITIDNVSLQQTGTFVPPAPPEKVKNGDFSFGDLFWGHWGDIANGATAAASYSNGIFTLVEPGRGTNDWEWSLFSDDKKLDSGKTYRIAFDASSTASDGVRLGLKESWTDVDGDGHTNTEWNNHSYSLNSSLTRYSYDFTMNGAYSDPHAVLIFYLGNTSGAITIDNVSLQEVTSSNLPSAPDLMVSSTTASTVSLSWTANGASGYRLYRSSSRAGPFSKVGADIASGTTATDSGLASSTTYWYRLSAYDANGEGAQGDAVSGRTSGPSSGGISVGLE